MAGVVERSTANIRRLIAGEPLRDVVLPATHPESAVR